MKTHTSTTRYFSVGNRLILGALIASLSWQAQAACTFFDNFKDNRDGTVTDPRNGLIWKRCAEGFTWNGSACEGREANMTWYDAMRAAKQSRFLDKSDWRIPTKAEFAAVVGKVDVCKNNNYKSGEYAASKDIVHPIDSSGYPTGSWTSSSYEGDSKYIHFVWGIYFVNGSVDGFGRDRSNFPARLVRSSQSAGGKAALEFNNEYKRVLAYDREQDTRARAQQAQERRDAEARQANSVAACKDKYVGQRVYMGKAMFNLDVFGEVLGVGSTRMTVRVLHPSGSRDVQEVNCSDY